MKMRFVKIINRNTTERVMVTLRKRSGVQDRRETLTKRREREAMCNAYLEDLRRSLDLTETDAVAVIDAAGENANFVLGQRLERAGLLKFGKFLGSGQRKDFVYPTLNIGDGKCAKLRNV